MAGLYDPDDERDSCGLGLIMQLCDQPARALVDRALDALARMTHRGGVAANGEDRNVMIIAFGLHRRPGWTPAALASIGTHAYSVSHAGRYGSTPASLECSLAAAACAMLIC